MADHPCQGCEYAEYWNKVHACPVLTTIYGTAKGLHLINRHRCKRVQGKNVTEAIYNLYLDKRRAIQQKRERAVSNGGVASVARGQVRRGMVVGHSRVLEILGGRSQVKAQQGDGAGI